VKTSNLTTYTSKPNVNVIAEFPVLIASVGNSCLLGYNTVHSKKKIACISEETHLLNLQA
jgi:hypothetical protein